MKSNLKPKNVTLYILGLCVSVFPVCAATLSYFPLWKDSGDGKLISGFALLFLLLAAKPIFKHFRRELSSPSVPVMWFLLFVVFFALSKIADEMTVIAFVGFISNTLGAVLFKASGIGGRRAVSEREQEL